MVEKPGHKPRSAGRWTVPGDAPPRVRRETRPLRYTLPGFQVVARQELDEAHNPRHSATSGAAGPRHGPTAQDQSRPIQVVRSPVRYGRLRLTDDPSHDQKLETARRIALEAVDCQRGCPRFLECGTKCAPAIRGPGVDNPRAGAPDQKRLRDRCTASSTAWALNSRVGEPPDPPRCHHRQTLSSGSAREHPPVSARIGTRRATLPRRGSVPPKRRSDRAYPPH